MPNGYKFTGKRVCGVGINDMPSGWCYRSNYNQRVYDMWRDMIARCYSSNRLERGPSYRTVIVCRRWHYLHNFVGDIKKLKGYSYWRDNPGLRVSLDKDILNPNSRHYSPKNCQFVDFSTNSSESISRNKHVALKGSEAMVEVKARSCMVIYPDGNYYFFKGFNVASRITGVPRMTLERDAYNPLRSRKGKYKDWKCRLV